MGLSLVKKFQALADLQRWGVFGSQKHGLYILRLISYSVFGHYGPCPCEVTLRCSWRTCPESFEHVPDKQITVRGLARGRDI